MRRFAGAPQRTGALVVTAALVVACATSKPRGSSQRCVPHCMGQDNCVNLDESLRAAKRPLLACIAREGRHSRLGTAHRCYRALRLLESARWWLRTLDPALETMPRIYNTPVESVRLEFFCRIERLARATTPEEVEERYLQMVRAYP